MPTKITHNRDRGPFMRQTVTAADGQLQFKVPSGATHGTLFVGPLGDCVCEIFTDVEPEPTPMSEMKPGEFGQVVSDSGSIPMCIGERVLCGNGSRYVTFTGMVLDERRHTVRILPPGESLTIEVVEAEPLSDDQFERLEDGTRKACGNCELHNPGPEICPRNDDNACLSPDPRGVNKFSHKLWTAPIEPETLAHALRGTAEEIVAAAGSVYALRDILIGRFGAVFQLAFDSLYARDDTEADDDARNLAEAFVELRDRLGLFKEGE